jgi:hypothetical protein
MRFWEAQCIKPNELQNKKQKTKNKEDAESKVVEAHPTPAAGDDSEPRRHYTSGVYEGRTQRARGEERRWKVEGKKPAKPGRWAGKEDGGGRVRSERDEGGGRVGLKQLPPNAPLLASQSPKYPKLKPKPVLPNPTKPTNINTHLPTQRPPDSRTAYSSSAQEGYC